MFGLKNQKTKLEIKYRQLLDEAFQLSRSNRGKSDEKTAEAEEVRKQLELLEKNEG